MDAHFIYLDGNEEREQLVRQIGSVRADVMLLAQRVPAEQHFEPRYQGRSLAVMLARLNAFDAATLWLVRAAANGYSLRIPRHLVRRADRFVCWFAQKRPVAVSARRLQRREPEIVELVRHVPMNALSANVIHPGRRSPYTVEKALQVYFVQHWQQQLTLMEQVDSVTGKL